MDTRSSVLVLLLLSLTLRSAAQSLITDSADEKTSSDESSHTNVSTKSESSILISNDRSSDNSNDDNDNDNTEDNDDNLPAGMSESLVDYIKESVTNMLKGLTGNVTINKTIIYTEPKETQPEHNIEEATTGSPSEDVTWRQKTSTAVGNVFTPYII